MLSLVYLLQTFASDNSAPEFGDNAIQFVGSIDGGTGEAAHVDLSQIVSFEGNLKDVPISAFYWAREIGVTDFSIPATTGMQGTIEFLDTNPTPTVLQTETFGLISGVSNSDYFQYTTDAPVVYTGTVTSKSIRITIGGDFNGSYYVDGSFPWFN